MRTPRILERLIVIGALVAACPLAVQAADEASAAGELKYSCGVDQPLVVRLAADRAQLIVALPTGQVLELPAQTTGSGFAYGDGKHSFSGQKDSILLQLQGQVPLACVAVKPVVLASATPRADVDATEICLLERLRSMPPTATLAEVRRSCQQAEMVPTESAPAIATATEAVAVAVPEEATGPVADAEPVVANTSSRLAGEWAAYDNPYALTLNRPSYLVLARQFSVPNSAPFQAAFPEVAPALDRNEAKFQISLKVPLALNLFDGRADLIAGYTNRSFWQVFNKEISSPFRETNHEPEVWMRWRSDLSLLGGRFRVISLGFNHQSNGQAGPLSRSWNRVFLESLYERGPFALNARVWQRLSEDAAKDDNPDMVDYMGRFELTGIYRLGESEFSAMFRRNLSTRKGAYQLDWSYPLFKNLRGYLQWFDGYGESLIDYNHRTRSLGIGVQLGGWLL
ncbi:phospholipase A1 [Hydrogenophaga palleronii]|uniref:Phospholipase A1 n=1 Tax=Hydrogenophaga palleronii TaxID=65655 RepID=A0ABU1WG04_9BURK|nr:phospholipase A [Hydrogenophaga palleronii]MDR7148197.1 phospholipase A1 [Hydrogenophaga palleronii]